MSRIAVIGAGAAGIFAAINIAKKNSEARITVFEKSKNPLSKVKISGGGRCNVTNARSKPSELVDFYPRGNKKLYKLFKEFSTDDMTDWLINHEVATKAEEDLRVFPVSNNSQTIIDCFLHQCEELKIKILYSSPITAISKKDESWNVFVNEQPFVFDYIIWATGSSEKSWSLLDDLQIEREKGVPSLFTFTIQDSRIDKLSGVSFSDTIVKIAGSKFSESGPLLITHWGLSGPAVLKLSSRAARDLNERRYNFSIIVNFLPKQNPDSFRKQIESEEHSKKLKNISIEGIPRRFWQKLLEEKNIGEKVIGELSRKDLNRIIEELFQAKFEVSGKSTFKEEFVTCGGVKLEEIDLSSMQSKKHPRLFFCGEVLDIDALTGGFNFQACWSEGWLISEYFKNRL